MSSWPLSASKNRTLVGTIPYFGVDLKFQGQLHDGAETFAMGIYRDLLAIAEDCLDPSIQFLGLYVDPQNIRGFQFWKSCDFLPLPGRTFLEGGVTYQAMLVRFRP